MRALVLSTSLLCLVCLVACSSDKPKEEPASASAPGAATKAGSAPATTPTADKPKPATNPTCSLLKASDFEAVGLTEGRAKGDGSMGGGACTWDPVLGKGGFLHLELITANQYGKRRERAGEKATPVTGIGDEAYVSPAPADLGIQVKKGDKYFRIDGNARLTQDKLESLARAVAGRL